MFAYPINLDLVRCRYLTHAVSFIVLSLLILLTDLSLGSSGWKADFDRLCGYTNQADEFSIEKLDGLVKECDALLAKIEKSGAPDKKIYLFRLKKCRNFFEYMADLKRNEQASD